MQVRPLLRNLRMTLHERQLTGPLAALEHGYGVQQSRHLATVTEGVQVIPRLEPSSARIVTATSTLRTWKTCPVRRFGTRKLKELASDTGYSENEMVRLQGLGVQPVRIQYNDTR
jgi:hypothetical protein